MDGLKPGLRLQSVTDSTEVVVVHASNSTLDLRCGGHPMVPPDQSNGQQRAIEPAFSDGTLLGKRYVDETAQLEVLCVKPGRGTLSLGATPLIIKAAKPLPASD